MSLDEEIAGSSMFHATRQQAGRPLIAAHRGTTSGCVFDNTTKSAQAAVRSGADIVELDVVRSSDNVYYAFHNGYEKMRLGASQEISAMSSSEVETQRFGKVLGHPGVAPVERFFDVVEALPDVLINVDRSWRYWGDDFLDELAQHCNPEHILIKSPSDEKLFTYAAQHPRMAYMVIAESRAEVERAHTAARTTSLNLVGAELLARTPNHELADRDYIAELHASGLLVWLNALNLEHLSPLFCGYDDDVSIFSDPEAGWGTLIDYGADVIQTDWPWLVRDYMDQRFSKEH